MTKLSRHQLGSLLLLMVSLLVGWRTLVATFALALRNDEYTYILLILPVSAAPISLAGSLFDRWSSRMFGLVPLCWRRPFWPLAW